MIAGFFNPDDLSYDEKMQIYTDCYHVTDYTYGLKKVAEFILEGLGNRSFAEEVYQKAITVIDDMCDRCLLAESIIEKFKDREWGMRLLDEAIAEAEQEPSTMAYLIIAESFLKSLHDKEKSDELYKLAAKYVKTADDIEALTDSVLNSENDNKSFLNDLVSAVTQFKSYSLN